MTTTTETQQPRIAYLADGKCFARMPGQAPQLIDSPFVQQMLDRISRSRQRNEWKDKSAGWQVTATGFSPFQRQMPAEVRRIHFSGLAAGAKAGEVIYALDTDYVGGLFTYDTAESHERRIIHRNHFRARDLARHPQTGQIALSLEMEDGSANIAIIDEAGRGLREVTEGDSLDQAPAWVAGAAGEQLVFQSAGIGRNQAGMQVAIGPYAIQKLDLDGGSLTTLLEADQWDYLLPRMLEDGTLLFIRRPYQPHERPSGWRILLDTLLFPWRLAVAIAHFLNFFSLMFARKPLMTAGGPPKEGPDSRYMMLFGKMIDAEKAIRTTGKDGAGGALVPGTWELVRRSRDGQEQVLARSVLSYDVCSADGSIVFTNGSDIHHLRRDGGSSHMCKGKLIQHVRVTS